MDYLDEWLSRLKGDMWAVPRRMSEEEIFRMCSAESREDLLEKLETLGIIRVTDTPCDD